LLKDKSQTFETFRNFYLWIQNEEKTHVGFLHTNIGREYASNELGNYLDRHGILH